MGFPDTGLIYIHNQDINKCIEYCINLIDHDTNLQSYSILYVNSTIPNNLFNTINALPIQFKSNTNVMKSFHYHRTNNLQDLQHLIALQETDFIMIIESLDQLIKLTNLEYAEVNSILNRVLLKLKQNKMSLLLDRYPNKYIEYYVDEVLEI